MKQLFIITLITMLCQGCIQLGGETQSSRYYLLETLAETVSAADSSAVNIKLGPIKFPGYLDRQQIVTRNSDNIIIAAPLDRWAEPLAENFQRTLQENLHRQLGQAEIQLAPWDLSREADYQVLLTINRFDATLGQQIHVDIRWELIPLQKNQTKITGHFQNRNKIGNSYSEMVRQLSLALAKLSHQLAENL